MTREKSNSNALPYQGYTSLRFNPDTGDWIAPAESPCDTEEYCVVATWTPEGYRVEDGRIFTGEPMEF
jgi:hypothetical protein